MYVHVCNECEFSARPGLSSQRKQGRREPRQGLEPREGESLGPRLVGRRESGTEASKEERVWDRG